MLVNGTPTTDSDIIGDAFNDHCNAVFSTTELFESDCIITEKYEPCYDELYENKF